MEINQNFLEQLELNQLNELAKFIVEENYNHHTQIDESTEILKETEEILKEEEAYFDASKIIVVKDNTGDIQGSIRVINWDFQIKLPIEKLFCINPSETLNINQEETPIWHIGRFATKKTNKDKSLFKKLMVNAISPICESKKGYALAECDSKLLRVMNLLGINTKIIGKSIFYLGSETIPIAMDYNDLKGFYENNRHFLNTNSQAKYNN